MEVTYDPTKEITDDQALAIVNEALSGGFYAETPTTPEATQRAARELISAAYEALEAKTAYPEVQAIIAIYENGPLPVDEAPPWEEPVAEEPEVVEEAEHELEPEPVLEKPKRKTRKKPDPVDDLVTREKLPVPADFDDPDVVLPKDFTVLSDVEIRRLHSTFHALMARATWVLAAEENDLAAAQNMHDMLLAKAVKEIGGDKITAAKTEAQTTPEVAEWRDKVLAHTATVKKLKALAHYYESTCKCLSREWTMRTGERESAGSLHQRFS